MQAKKTFQFILSLLVMVGFILIIALYWQPKAATDNNLKVYFLDVGQGDASYIKTPTGEDILIDGGPDSSILNELGKVMPFSDREINLVILSHPHTDHLTGLLDVLTRYKIDEVWETGVEYPSATYDSWRAAVKSKQIPDTIVKAGDEKSFGDTKIKILSPLSPIENKTLDNLNNASIVSRLDYNKFSVLYTGDAEKEVQTKLLANPETELFATVLKVAHHGSSNGLAQDFLNAVRPAIAVISVGYDNKFSHPHTQTLNLLKGGAVRIYRTDQNGTIEISSNGENYWVNSLK